jgi:hypothetical protein
MGQQKNSENTLLKEALTYTRWGWSIIPVPAGSKKARIKWKRYQTEAPDEGQIRKWFSGIEKKNMAVVLGPVSGGLVCRDFDVMETYQTWARNHPKLVKQLPIAQTDKGMHVYFVNQDIQGIKHIGDGELRASGGYCLLPPSVHPNGSEYEWFNYPASCIPEIDPYTAGFMGDVTEQTENTEQTEANRANIGNEDNGNKTTAPIPAQEFQLNTIFQKTLPTEPGTRNRKAFTLARELKSLPHLCDADPRDLIEIVKQWHKQALPNIRTKEFEETWIDFLKGWDNVKFNIGEEPMTAITEKAFTSKPPKIAAEKYPDNPQLQIFVSLCRELQRSDGQKTFFVSCRKAAELLKTSPMTISRWFFLLESDGIVKTIEKGGTAQNPRKASRYKYLGN